MSGEGGGIIIGGLLLIGAMPLVLGAVAVAAAATGVVYAGKALVGAVKDYHQRKSQLMVDNCSGELSDLYDQMRAVMEDQGQLADACLGDLGARLDDIATAAREAADTTEDEEELARQLAQMRSDTQRELGESRKRELERISAETQAQTAKIQSALEKAVQARIAAVDWQKETEAARALQHTTAQAMLRDAEASLRMLQSMARSAGDPVFTQKVAVLEGTCQRASQELERGLLQTAAASAQQVVTRSATLALQHEQELFERDQVGIALTARLEGLRAELDAQGWIEFDDSRFGHCEEHLDDFTQDAYSHLIEEIDEQLAYLASPEGRRLGIEQLQLRLDEVEGDLVGRVAQVIDVGHAKMLQYYERLHALQVLRDYMSEQGYETDWTQPVGSDVTQMIVIHFRDPVTGNGISVSLDEDQDTLDVGRMAMEVMFYYAGGREVTEAEKEEIRQAMLAALRAEGLGGELSCTGSVGTEASDPTRATADEVEHLPVRPVIS